MEFYFLIVILILIGVFVFLFKNKNTNIRPSYEKKSDLIASYEEELKSIINDNQHNKELLKTKKMQYLKTVSQELHNNIFFDENEVKQIIQRLASM